MQGRRARGHSSTVGSGVIPGSDEEEMEGDRSLPLPQPNWYVDLCCGTDFVRTAVTHPAFDESPRIDPNREQVNSLYGCFFFLLALPSV